MTFAFRVGFAGMSHLGLVSAAALASRGVSTVGFDPDPALVQRISAGALPVVEPGLPDLLQGSNRPMSSADANDLRSCAVVYVALDVATDDAGHSDLTALNALLDTV